MNHLFLSLIILLVFGINGFSQEKSRDELKGDRFSFSYSFNKAIKSYTHSKQLSAEGQRKLAESYHKIDLNVESEAVYSGLVSSQEGIIPEDYYNYAMILKSNGKYDEAIKMMYLFINMTPDVLRALDFKNHSNELNDLLKDHGKYKIEHLNINSEALDFGTSFYKDKIVFASTRITNNLRTKQFSWTQKPFWDMYVSEVDGDQLKTPEIFEKSLNGKIHDGPASFSNDGTFMAFTRNNYEDKTGDRIVELQIQFSSFKEGKWSKPVPFILNSKEYSVGQPCLTSDGRTMYFTSDMPGGFGKTDIYRISKDMNGEWGKHENLGNKINSEGDEMFPYVVENTNMLFFSSNGRFGLGGLDIFNCPVIGPGFGPVCNTGFPLNTQYNDFALILNGTTKQGYFSSDRINGSGGDDIYSVAFLKPDVRFSVLAPDNIPIERRIRETFPLRNYVFFNSGSSEVPDRYVMLLKDQVKDFNEDRLEEFSPIEISGRSKRQMIVYYNVLNILGVRMVKNPSTIVRLSGASMESPDDGLAMAEAIKRYLADIFGIDPSRLNTEGRIKPRIPSEQPGGTKELDLLREGDRRVSIWSESPDLLMEFQSGPDVPLKPVQIIGIQEAPPDSYVSFNVDGAEEVLSSWSLEMKDKAGAVQKFGPYSIETVSIPGKSILGNTPEGDFKVTMTGQTKNGETITKEADVRIRLWTPPENQEMTRFSIIFEFNDSHAITTYDKYLTDIVTPKIPKDGKVIIHGHTDIIGSEVHNQELSIARANEVKRIIEKALLNSSRNDVRIEVYGFGEDKTLSPFDNKYPEERFYNRTVIVDIIPPG